MSRWIRVCSFAGWIALVACGGASSGSAPGSVVGTIHGDVYTISDAISAPVTFIGTTQHGAAIQLSSSPSLCKDATSPPIYHPNEKGILIELFDSGPTDTTPTGPGTYTIYSGSGQPPAKTAALAASVLDATCQRIASSVAKAAAGTVTLGSVNGNVFSGSYDVVLDSGDHVSGDFDPEDCAGLQTELTSTATPTCM